jgi:hypothetical protein
MNNGEPSPNREKNVEFANQQLDAQIAYRDGRKDSQENAARGVVVAAGVVLTLLIGGVATAENVNTTTCLFRVAFVAAGGLALAAGACGLFCQWPRSYERLGAEAFDRLKDPEFLDKPLHEVGGSTLAAKVEIAKTADRLHEDKAKWLGWSLGLLLAAFIGLAVLAGVVVFQDDGKPAATTTRTTRAVTTIRETDDSSIEQQQGPAAERR